MSSTQRSSTATATTASTAGPLVPIAPPASGKLVFHGWWYEDAESPDMTLRVDVKGNAGGGLALRTCTLEYLFASSTFTFATTNRDQELKLEGLAGLSAPAATTATRHGATSISPKLVGLASPASPIAQPISLWDLHVGAHLVVLGRLVCLKHADQQTMAWHAQWSERLLRVRGQLCADIQKYKPRALGGGLTMDRGAVKAAAGKELRHLAWQVRTLIEDLRQYRPSKADAYMAALPVEL